MAKDFTELVIDRKRWLRGEEKSALVRKFDKKMCCLGFLGRACGIRRKDMVAVARPERLNSSSDIKKWPAWLVSFIEMPAWQDADYFDTGRLGQQLMSLNDNQEISDKMREYKLKRKFKSVGLEVEFIN